MKGRILVVDDEADIRLILRSSLEPDYEVVEAHDGLDALEKLERYEPDFVCLDVMMPLMDGHETCEAIRKNPKFATTPVMFLTAMSKKEDMKTGYSKGANLYMTKPFDTDRLLKNINVHFQEIKSLRKKSYTIDQIKDFESGNVEPPTPAGPSFELPDNISAESREKIIRATRKIEKPAEVSDEPKPYEPRPRVLLVDDDEDILMIMEHALEDHAEIIKAMDGIEAIQHLVKYQPDVLVIDIMLPKMNGFQLVKSLRSNRAFQTIPILMCSAKTQKKDIDLALKTGANEFLPKPFEGSDLLAKIKEMEKSPNYKFRPNKKITWEEIQKENEPESEMSDVFGDQDVEHREKLEQLAREANKEAVEEESEKPKKRKRRLFGFGR